MDSIEIIVDGKVFESVSEACKFYGIIKSTYYNRRNRGLSNEEIFGLKKVEYTPQNVKSITVNGVTYSSISEACEELGKNLSTVKYRLQSGWSIEEAFDLVEKKIIRHIGNNVTVFGEEYPSLKKACKELRVNYSNVYHKINLGLTIEEAISEARLNKKDTSIKVFGVVYKSVREACKALNVSYAMVRFRLKKGWSVEKAFSIEPKEKSNIIVNDIEYLSIKDACEKLNKDYARVQARLQVGWSVEEAFDLVENNSHKSIVVGGVVYDSIYNACSVFNIKPGAVYHRFSKGWTEDEAFELIPRCVNGIIDKNIWNRSSLVGTIKIVEVIGGKLYKCISNGDIRYYSKDELFKKWGEFKCQKN